MVEIVLGPPGTGKTTTLLGIVDEELARGTPPDRIAYVSFTRRASQEAVERACARFSLRPRDFPWFRTLHSLCFRFMGVTSSVVLDGTRMREFADYIGETIGGIFSMEDGTFWGSEPGDRMLFMDNLARIRGRSLAEQYREFHDDLDWGRLERFSQGLARFKAAHSLIDYTDMLESFVQTSASPDIEVLLVDEAQDLSQLQWRVVRKLSVGCRRVVVAGDDDQAIYRWAGADVEHLIDMEGDVRVLGQSWRVPRNVQHEADTVIARVRHRRPKAWMPRDEDGDVEWHRDLGSIDWSGEQSILVLARNAVSLRRVESDLKSAGYLYERGSSPSVDRATLRAVVTWEHMRQGRRITAAEARHMYTLLSSGVGVARGHKTLPGWPDDLEVSEQDLRDRGGLLARGIWHEAMDRIPAVERAYMVRCRRQGERFSVAPRIRLSTIHGSKGGEADRVVLLTDMAPRTEIEYALRPDDEHRTWYVALTRARRTLQIIEPATRRFYAI